MNVGNNTITVQVTAADATTKTYTVTVTKAQSFTANASTPIQVTTDPKTINVPSSVTNAQMKTTTTTTGSNNTATLPLVDVHASTSLGNVSVTIPQGTKVTGSSSWDGTIELPKAVSSSSVSVPNGNVGAVIELGSTGESLTFDKAVRILVPNQGGKKIGFIRSGIFTEITQTLSADNQDTADSEIAAGGVAKITVGNDMVIWTKHFTQFVTYTETSSQSSGGTAGGTTSGATSGGTLPVNSTIILAASGGQATLNGVTVNVPSGESIGDFTVTVDPVSDESGIPEDGTLQRVSNVFEIVKNKSGDFSKPVDITLPFDLSKVNFTQSTVAIYWLNEQTSQWVPLDNLRVDKTLGTATGSVSHFTKFAVLATNTTATSGTTDTNGTTGTNFTDLNGHWAQADVQELVKQGVTTGYADNTFKPDTDITRAEFVTMIGRAFHIPTTGSVAFRDTANHWAKNEIADAVAAGIVNGYADGLFRPDQKITREEMATIVIRAAKLAAVASPSLTFTDSNQISAWASPSMSIAVANGLFKGYDDKLMPQAYATRAEAVAVIVRAFKLNS